MASITPDTTEASKKGNPNIVSMCLVTQQTLDRSRGITLTVIKFDSIDPAEARFELMHEDISSDVTESDLGPRSFKTKLKLTQELR